jgi:Carboxypeptidase regulatory-like domain
VNRKKLVGGALALVVVVGAVWFIWLRGSGGEAAKQDSTEHGRSAEIKPVGPQADHDKDRGSPRGMAPTWKLDVDVEGPLRLEGEVVNAEGNGAEVWLTSAPPRSVKTDDDGTFAFDKLVGRAYQLTAQTAELIGGPVTYKLGATSDPVVIHLGEGAGLEVEVVDDAKQPIANAEVKLSSIGEHVAKSDDKGKATLRPVHPGWLSVEVTAPGYAPNGNFTSVGSAGAVAKMHVTLHRGVSVSGRVVDEAGKPIAKAHVSANDTSAWGWSRDADSVLSDDKGQFTIAALAPGAHALSASDGEHAIARTPPITVASQPITGIEIKMKAGGTLSGTVVDTDGKFVPFATVRVAGTGAMMWTAARQVTTDKVGTFELRGLVRTKLQARAESDTSASKVTDVDLTTDGAKKGLKLVLDVGGVIAGSVVDDKGQPVPEVEVHAFPDIMDGAAMKSASLAGMSSTTSGGDGSFTIHGLPDGSYKLSAARGGNSQRDWGQDGTKAKVGDKSVKIVLSAPGILVGKLMIDGQTAPPALATVQLGRTGTTPIADGVFTVKDLTPGTYDVTFRGVDFAEFIKRDVKIDAGQTTDLGTVTVMRGRKLVGKVVDNTGAAVANAKIKVGDMLFTLAGADDQAANFDEISGIKTTFTDQNGGFTLVGIPVKATNIAADHPDKGRSIAMPVPEGTDDPPAMTLALRGFGSIVGVVTMKGQPQADVTISDTSKDGGAQAMFARTAEDGSFTLAKAPEGTHVLAAMQSDGGLGMSMKSTSISVVVVAGKQTTATIDIPVGQVTLTVSITALPGNQVDAAQVFLLAGTVQPTNAKQMMDGFLGGTVKGVKIWFGAGKPFPEFDEVVPGSYTVCAIPVTGNFMDPTFQQRVGKNTALLKVYCKPIAITASPLQQTLAEELPSMTPLPPS